MTDENKTHAPLPYHIEKDYDWILNDKGNIVANCTGHITQHEDALFIVKSCNNFLPMLEALKEIRHALPQEIRIKDNSFGDGLFIRDADWKTYIDLIDKVLKKAEEA